MTQVPAVPDQQAGAAVQPYDPSQFASTGLEDFSMSDAVMPRIKINHERGTWGDNLTGMEFETLRFIPLGLVKQRVLFHPNVEDGDVPMCKSSDYVMGYPNIEAPAAKSFPWDKSGFNPDDFPPDAEGNRALPCDGCQLKEWGSHPLGNTPYCSEQWTMPIYYEQSGLPDDHPDGGVWIPAILTLQKSSIRPIRTYLTPFANSDRPPFLAIARGTLRVQTRGTVTYSTPSFVKEGDSDRSRWLEFSEQFLEMRSYLQRPPIKEGDDAPVADNTNTAPVQQAPVQQPPVQQQAPVQQPPVQQPPAQQAPPPMEDPWATPAPVPSADLPPVAPPTPAPVAEAPVAPAPVPPLPTPPVAQPAAQPAAPPPPAPVAAPEQPAPPAAAAPQAVPEQPAAPAAPAGTELPF